MDEFLIEQWNSVVRDGDRVYHLGDVTFDYKKFDLIRPRLRGSIRLIPGNHDDFVKCVQGNWFKKIQYWRLFKDEGFTCTHVPLRRDQMRHYTIVNVHGHTHKEQVDEPGFFNVCVENHNYVPVSMDTIKWFVESQRHLIEELADLKERFGL
jgi:calcineurin-like phosphoesterase family protein